MPRAPMPIRVWHQKSIDTCEFTDDVRGTTSLTTSHCTRRTYCLPVHFGKEAGIVEWQYELSSSEALRILVHYKHTVHMLSYPHATLPTSCLAYSSRSHMLHPAAGILHVRSGWMGNAIMFVLRSSGGVQPRLSWLTAGGGTYMRALIGMSDDSGYATYTRVLVISSS